MPTPAHTPAVQGSWGSVRGGKWHRTISASPTFVHDEQSLCGLTFRPLNVTWDERPTTHPAYICQRCEKRAKGEA